MQTAPQASSEMQGRYWDRGWVAVPDVFGAAEVEAVAKTAMAVSSGEITRSSAPSYTVDQSDDGRVAPRKVDWPFLKHATFRTFVLDDRLVELVEMILGPEPCLLRDQLFMKPPGFGSAKPYHQENAPLGIEPADEFLVAWIALDDATVDNGCLRYIDGSHRSAVAHRPVAGREFDVAATTDATYHCRESTVEVSRGAVLLHHSLMLHASMGNRSGSWRRAYSSHWVTDRVTSSTGALDHAYSRRLATRPAAIQAP